mmetsp:Transcript_40679/g.88114  ORF Transcript_40679/g.88114 Transcript_40679/m.88114 type:complete len:86 (-) Transcript_40679:960-1217(-)
MATWFARYVVRASIWQLALPVVECQLGGAPCPSKGALHLRGCAPAAMLTSQPHGGHKDCHNQIFRVRPHQASRQSSGGCHAVLLK